MEEGAIQDPTSATEMPAALRQRLTSLEIETVLPILPPRIRKGKPRPSSPLSSELPFRILTISFLLCLFTVGIGHWSSGHGVIAELIPLQDLITNNKIFHHNRTTPAALAVAAKQKPPKTDNAKSKSKNRPAKSGGGGQRPTPPHHPSNLNINNYFKTAINILSMGLGAATTPKSIGWAQEGNEKPSSPPPPVSSYQATTLHPLSVLKTHVNKSNSSPETTTLTGSMDNKGRSTFDVEPLFESSYDKNGTKSGSGSSGKKMEGGFFDKFEDHWDDPMAEESAPNSFNDIAPRPSFQSAPSGSVLRTRPTSHAHPPQKPWKPSENKYVPQKHVNYWPTKLNSYYGIQEKPVGVYGRRPAGVFPAHHGGVGNHFDGTKQQQQEYDNDDGGADEPLVSSESASVGNYQKTTIMDRVSVFYSQYKVLAWAIVVVGGAVVALGALLGLYLNNPPTEVVTARRELTRAINDDPRLRTFLESLSRSSSSSSTPHAPPEEGNQNQKRRT